MDKLKKILLVEDDPKDVELTIEALTEHNLANRLVVAHDGQQALGYLGCNGEANAQPGLDPAVIILDLKLPKVSGLEVLQAIRSNPSTKQLPVVVLTSSRQEQDLMRSYDLGANAYVVKPIEFHQFVDAVKTLGVFWAIVNEAPPASFS